VRCSEYPQGVMPFSTKIAANADVFASSLDVGRPQVDASCLDASPVVTHRVMVASLSCVVDSRDNYSRSDSSIHDRIDAPRMRTSTHSYLQLCCRQPPHSILIRASSTSFLDILTKGRDKQERQMPRTRRDHMTTSSFGVCALVVSRPRPVFAHQPRVSETLEARYALGQ
jgi:hypothetical protein